MNQPLSSDHEIFAASMRRMRVCWGFGNREALAVYLELPSSVVEFAEKGLDNRTDPLALTPKLEDLMKVVNYLRFTGDHKDLMEKLAIRILAVAPSFPMTSVPTVPRGEYFPGNRGS